jgi:hypothetical protein
MKVKQAMMGAAITQFKAKFDNITSNSSILDQI